MTEPTPDAPRRDDTDSNVRLEHVDASTDLEAITATYGRAFALGVVHSCALLTLNTLAHDLLAHARAVGRLNDGDVADIRGALSQASADASGVVFEALCQERSAVEILQTAQELRQRAVSRANTPPGFKPV